jgi:hypothetical protein
MKKTWRVTLLSLSAGLILTAISACDLSEQEIVATASNLSSSELAGIAATVEALSPQQAAALEELAVNAGLPTLSPAERSAHAATVDAARATATAVGQAASSGERVNATEAPDAAPIIIYFFASAPNQAQAKDGIRYFLNWTTENTNRVEIFGHVMDNPAQGSWAVYNPSNDWVLWAANDIAWVESQLLVQPDHDTGATLQPVTVNSRNVTLTFRDPQFVDGDQIGVDLNGVRLINNYITTGRNVTFPVTLQPGVNTISIETQSAGVTAPMVAEITVDNVVSGPAVQQTRGMNPGERQDFAITAP